MTTSPSLSANAFCDQRPPSVMAAEKEEEEREKEEASSGDARAVRSRAAAADCDCCSVESVDADQKDFPNAVVSWRSSSMNCPICS